MNRVEHIMGLPISVDLRDGDPSLVDEAFEWLREADARFSPFKSDSEVSRLGRGELSPDELTPDLVEVLDLCAWYEEATGGAFKLCLPGRGLDPCAVVKGWAVERAGEVLLGGGARNFCLNAGGDVFAAGEPTPGKPWRVGVRHPEDADKLCVVLAVRDGSVATSAFYERGEHIIDGRTGEPARGLLSLTVYAPDLTTADATATAAFAMGLEGVEWAAAQENCEVFAVTSDRRVMQTAGLPVEVC
ncbi:FAD:protein FMN transferase [Lentzea sp. NBRC 105346]|uniref:FAD:protein FMN transferase n=1 Tax=Lentzea sp. NBRC 105346 TaxID=3032205 RepID=UPI0024A24621|nr:FAD:protein FMN transferase [Lentzea sp. NBRC 105346]GLZ32847.1 FAD:protein FMN transferase [Lentzea sp. NBRC 105346]